jgi:hypothetical protein
LKSGEISKISWIVGGIGIAVMGSKHCRILVRKLCYEDYI